MSGYRGGSPQLVEDDHEVDPPLSRKMVHLSGAVALVAAVAALGWVVVSRIDSAATTYLSARPAVLWALSALLFGGLAANLTGREYARRAEAARTRTWRAARTSRSESSAAPVGCRTCPEMREQNRALRAEVEALKRLVSAGSGPDLESGPLDGSQLQLERPSASVEKLPVSPVPPPRPAHPSVSSLPVQSGPDASAGPSDSWPADSLPEPAPVEGPSPESSPAPVGRPLSVPPGRAPELPSVPLVRTSRSSVPVERPAGSPERESDEPQRLPVPPDGSSDPAGVPAAAPERPDVIEVFEVLEVPEEQQLRETT